MTSVLLLFGLSAFVPVPTSMSDQVMAMASQSWHASAHGALSCLEYCIMHAPPLCQLALERIIQEQTIEKPFLLEQKAYYASAMNFDLLD